MPANAFPLHKRKSYRLAKGWRYVVHELSSNDMSFRLLVAYERAKEEFQSWLCVVDNDNQSLVARLEIHDSHGGWHCHWKAGDLASLTTGVVRAGQADRIRQCKAGNRYFDESSATSLAFKIFNVQTDEEQGSLL